MQTSMTWHLDKSQVQAWHFIIKLIFKSVDNSIWKTADLTLRHGTAIVICDLMIHHLHW